MIKKIFFDPVNPKRKGALFERQLIRALQDVSCNEITQLPDKIGDAESLRSLNVRKNLLVELPISMYTHTPTG